MKYVCDYANFMTLVKLSADIIFDIITYCFRIYS